MKELPLNPISRARHDLRNPISDIIGFSEMLGEEAVRMRRSDVAAELQAIYQAGLQMLKQVNQGLDPEQVKSGLSHLPNLQLLIRAYSEMIVSLIEKLKAKDDPVEDHTFADDLNRIAHAAQTLLTRAPALLGPLAEALLAAERQPAPAQAAEYGAPQLLFGSQAATGQGQMAPELGSQLAELDGTGRRELPSGAVLVVEDDENHRELLARRLRQQGHTVLVAESGPRALEMLRTDRFDLVILDFMMPEMNGYEVLERMKADEILRHIPVLMLSGLDDFAKVVRCIERGADDYLTKPFDPVLLKARVGACLEKKRAWDREVAYLRQIEMEKQRADYWLRVLLPDEVAEELRLTNVVKPRRFEDAVILFADVVGFTTWCDQHPPDEVVDNIQALFLSFEALLQQHGLEKIQTVGDCLMAAGGILSPLPNPALACVRCGLAMIAATRQHPAQWRVHVGIHLGPVVTGVLGLNRFRFDLVGDTVNTAARVQTQSPADSVCVSAATWHRIAPVCEGHSLGVVPVKGKREMEIFQVNGVID